MKKHFRLVRSGLVILSCSMSMLACAQNPTDSLPPDPGAIYVTTNQNLKFGAFTQGSGGGTVVISNSGTRSVTGSVVAISMGITYFQAIINVMAPPGSMISITNGADATLSGSNGGSVSLHIGNSDPVSPFSTSIPPPGVTPVNIGGTLTVGNPSAAPPGNYSGLFYITFNQE